MATALALGAPGIYRVPAPSVRRITGVRMDVAAFVGVAPRGPASLPALEADWVERRWEGVRDAARTVAVPVESWEAYANLYGAFEGVGLLPYAVASFFDQGGRRAYIARIVPGGSDARDGVAWGRVAGLRASSGADDVKVWARNQGVWGNALQTEVSLDARRLTPRSLSGTDMHLTRGSSISVGVLLRGTLGGGATELRYVVDTVEEWSATEGRVLHATLESAFSAMPARLEVLDARLTVREVGTPPAGAERVDRTERYTGLGLASAHPRWMGKVLALESELLRPDPAWVGGRLSVADGLVAGGTLVSEAFTGGADRYEIVVPDDFFDDAWDPAADTPGDGIQALGEVGDLALLVVPDLYSPEPLAPTESVQDPDVGSGPRFAPCLPTAEPVRQAVRRDDLTGLRLVPPGDLDAIIALQSRVVDFADARGDIHALLDVPPGLDYDAVVRWRSHFASIQAAAYHPWLRVGRAKDARDALIDVPPSAVAAGIIASSEEQAGVEEGPANVIARNVLDVTARITRAEHDLLHPMGINVYLLERDGVRLTAARSLSDGPEYRQISVRRIVTLIVRTLEQRMRWTVFEPNNARLRREVRSLVRGLLRELYRAGAFRGATEQEAFFVRCDESLNPPRVVDAGQLVCEVGVSPAEPLEFIALLLVRGADGTVLMEG